MSLIRLDACAVPLHAGHRSLLPRVRWYWLKWPIFTTSQPQEDRGLGGRLSSLLPAPGCTCSFVSGSSPRRKELLKPEELVSSRHLAGNSLVTLGKRSQPEEDGPGSCTGNGRGGGHHRLKVNRMIEGGLQAGLTTVPWETLLGTCLLQV